MTAYPLLIIDDEKNTREALKRLLSSDYTVSLASGVEEALEILQKQTFSVIITDLRLGGNTSGFTIIQAAAKKNIPCIMMTAFGDVDTAVTAMRCGAFDFVTKPLNFQKLKITLKQAVEQAPLPKTESTPEFSIPSSSLTVIAAPNSPFYQVLENAKKIANNRANVLIYGETGTGKEVLAQTIHQSSSRAQGPLITVHCAALPPLLLESELFGHEKGAFTGATEARIGKFEAANHGTLFLDEIGEIDANIQVKLLRFLETKSLERIGSNKTRDIDVRIIAATNKNLAHMVREGTFREDLYYRLDILELKSPPLRERPEDIPLLFAHYIHYFCRENQLADLIIEDRVFYFLKKYSWPGNVRELKNVCESIVALMPEGQQHITPDELGEKFR